MILLGMDNFVSILTLWMYINGLETTVAAIFADTPSDPDYRSMYENYKQLLNEKTADLQHQMNEFRESIQKKNGDYSELRDIYRKLQESNGAAESELIEKFKEIARLKKQISVNC